VLGHVETLEYVGEVVGWDARTIVSDPDLDPPNPIVVDEGCVRESAPGHLGGVGSLR